MTPSTPFETCARLLAAALLFTVWQAPIAAAADPSPAAGASGIKADVLYHNYCSVCHGDRGDGKSRARGSLVPPPKDFTQPPLMPTEAMIEIVRNGKPGTAMVGWKTQLNDAEVAAVVDFVRNTFGRVATDPRLARGRSLYGHNCSVCHGDRGQGGVAHGGSGQPARNFTAQVSRTELTRERMVDAVMHGRKGTAMAAFSSRLSAPDIEAVVDYVREVLMQSSPELVSGTRAHTGRKEAAAPAAQATASGKADMAQPLPRGLQGRYARGEKFYMANCATCHGEKGDGKGPRAYFIKPKPKNFLDDASRAVLNRPILFATISMGKLGTEMPAWSKVLTDQEIADVAEFVFRQYIRPAPKEAARKGN